MILVDWEIRELCEQGLVVPYLSDLINPASLDIRVGISAILELEEHSRRIDLSEFTAEKPFFLYPNDCALIGSLEFFRLPEDVAAEFKLKSSRAREWYQHSLAGFCDPGWAGCLTMELKNIHPYKRLPLYPGLKIGQLIFFKLSNYPQKSYPMVGRYHNDSTVVGSKG